MKHRHPPRSDIERYVSNDLDDESAHLIEEHAVECEACAKLLASEAQIEVELHEAARESPRDELAMAPTKSGSVVQFKRPLRALLAVALTAAALVLLLVWRGSSTSHKEAPQPNTRDLTASDRGVGRITCEASVNAAEKQCRAQARCSGRFVEDERQTADIPHYEKSLTECNRAPGLRGSQKGSL